MENTKLSSADFRFRQAKNALECVKESVWKCLSEKAGLETGAVEHNARKSQWTTAGNGRMRRPSCRIRGQRPPACRRRRNNIMRIEKN